MTEKVKARSLAFVELVDGPAFSICLDDGRHFFIGMSDRQAALVSADSGAYVFKQVAKQHPERPFE
jgi:hypothetical protein